jgi:hypothetical protein
MILKKEPTPEAINAFQNGKKEGMLILYIAGSVTPKKHMDEMDKFSFCC